MVPHVSFNYFKARMINIQAYKFVKRIYSGLLITTFYTNSCPKPDPKNRYKIL